MIKKIPMIIQGGMGAGVSSWTLARAVSRLGQLGVVAGTALDQILTRRLQDGDPNGMVRQALDHFPFPKIARRILDDYFIPGGRPEGKPYKPVRMHTVVNAAYSQELCVAANFVEIFLAKLGHDNPVGINYLEKIQLPHLPSLYGAMLAGVAVVIVGAGIPVEFAGAMDALAEHQPVRYAINVTGAAAGEKSYSEFDPACCGEAIHPLRPLERPAFLPIISSDTLAVMLCRRLKDGIQGFVIEGPLAGGHNAPPRGQMKLTEDGQPIYGERDVVDLDVIRKLGLPFWLAGSYGSPERLKEALALGASGVQVGTPFALCEESGIRPDIRRKMVTNALQGKASVFTDPLASPTGFPFKVGQLEGTLSDEHVYSQRRRVCDLGFLREVYRRENGTLGYRCAAEPESQFVAKGGKLENTLGRACLCNALIANVGMPQELADGTRELPLITLGDDYAGIGRFCKNGQPDYSAADVIHTLLGA